MSCAWVAPCATVTVRPAKLPVPSRLKVRMPLMLKLVRMTGPRGVRLLLNPGGGKMTPVGETTACDTTQPAPPEIAKSPLSELVCDSAEAGEAKTSMASNGLPMTALIVLMLSPFDDRKCNPPFVLSSLSDGACDGRY